MNRTVKEGRNFYMECNKVVATQHTQDVEMEPNLCATFKLLLDVWAGFKTLALGHKSPNTAFCIIYSFMDAKQDYKKSQSNGMGISKSLKTVQHCHAGTKRVRRGKTKELLDEFLKLAKTNTKMVPPNEFWDEDQNMEMDKMVLV